MNILTLINAYKQLNEIDKKQKALDKMAAGDINYGILKDLINSAHNGVHIEVMFKDGTKLDIKKADSFDRLQKTYMEGF